MTFTASGRISFEVSPDLEHRLRRRLPVVQVTRACVLVRDPHGQYHAVTTRVMGYEIDPTTIRVDP